MTSREGSSHAKSRIAFLTFKDRCSRFDSRLQVVFLKMPLYLCYLMLYLCKLVKQNCRSETKEQNCWYCRYDIQSVSMSEVLLHTSSSLVPWIDYWLQLVRRAPDLYILVSSKRRSVCAVQDQFQYEMKHGRR